MISLSQDQITSLKSGLMPTDIPLHFQRDVDFMIDVNGSCLLAIWSNNDVDVIEEGELTEEEFAQFENETTLIRVR
jgi:hypothetical protein